MAPLARPTSPYMRIEGSEYLELYEEGGYHHVKLGDRLDSGRYEVVHKLGHGAYSTVWLAREADSQRLVAVKIAIASTHEGRRQGESEILRELGLAAESHPWGKYVQRILGTFVETGPNGRHECLVSEPAGGSLAASKADSDCACLFPLEVSRAICAQMIQATTFLHSQGIVHGDIYLGNIFIASFKQDTRQPERIPVQRRDGTPLPAGVPAYVVWPGTFCPPSSKMTLADAHIVLADFGQSWAPAREERHTLHTARNYRAPDPLLDPLRRPLGPASDIWSLGLALYAVYGTCDLFEAHAKPDHMVVEAIVALGRPPPALWDAWAGRSACYDDAGTPKLKWLASPYPLDQCVRDIGLDREDAHTHFPKDPPFGEEEMQDVLYLLRSMLRWSADDRVTASELSSGVWMQKWGLPALGEMGGPQWTI